MHARDVWWCRLADTHTAVARKPRTPRERRLQLPGRSSRLPVLLHRQAAMENRRLRETQALTSTSLEQVHAERDEVTEERDALKGDYDELKRALAKVCFIDAPCDMASTAMNWRIINLQPPRHGRK